MRVYWKILTSAIIFVVTRMIISLLTLHLHRSLPFPFPWERPVWFLYVDLLDWIGFLVYPILFVVVSYFLGKNLDLKRNLRAAMISLFIGCFTGHLIGNSIIRLYFTIYAISTDTNNYIYLLISLLFVSVIYTIISFLIGFSGLALGYLRKPKTLLLIGISIWIIPELIFCFIEPDWALGFVIRVPLTILFLLILLAFLLTQEAFQRTVLEGNCERMG